jgi:transposase
VPGDSLRAELAELRAALAEAQRTVLLLTDENAALRARLAELERRVGQNPRNSNKPPSSEGYEKPAPRSRRERTGRRSGGQPGHPGVTLRRVAEPDRVETHEPDRCGCGASLHAAEVVGTEARQVFDLPEITLQVVEHRLVSRRCGCGRVTAAAAPAGVGAPVQYGPGVKALAVELLAGQHLPLARTGALLTGLCGAGISEGTLAGWYLQAADGLAGFEADVRDRLTGAAVVGVDETGLRVAGRLAWLHATRTDLLTLLTVDTKRGVAGITAAGVLPGLSPEQVVVSDGWAPYWTFDVTHALCGAHLLRELTAAAEVAGQHGWAAAMDGLLVEVNRTVTAGRDGGADALPPARLAGYRRRYDEIITAGWAANPDHAPGTPVRGRQKRPKHVNLLDRLDRQRAEVLRFAADFRVPFTNNGSERDIRPTKIRMKVTGGLRTMTGAQAFARLRSYLSTANKHGLTGFTVLRMLHAGNPWIPPKPAPT